jgi:hypothetical protein
MFKFSIREINYVVNASSNPWSGKATGKISKFRLWELQSATRHNRQFSHAKQGQFLLIMLRIF